MPRPPDPNSKIVRVFLTAKPGEETKVRAFKEICARNNKKVRDVLMEKVDAFLREHNYPPGNSQTLIEVYLEPPKKPEPPPPECMICKKPAVDDLQFKNKPEVIRSFCDVHRKAALETGKWQEIETG